MQDEALRSPWYRRVILTVLILAVGAGGTFVLVKMRKKPKRKPKVKAGLLVRVLKVAARPARVVIQGHGQVQPRREVDIVPQVSGKVTRIHRALVVGGMIRKGEVLLTIDRDDYTLGVERALAGVAKAEQALALEQSNARVARREWKMVGASVKGGVGQPSPLALHEPQLRSAQASLASAKADLKLARLNLSRTTLRAPFSLRVRSESAEVGQYVMTGKAVAQVYGTDTAEVVVPLPLADLHWLDVPRGSDQAARGPEVVLLQKSGVMVYRRRGRLVRSVGEIDATGRMSRVVVAVADPYGLEAPGGSERLPDLEMGTFVEVAIQGKALDRAFTIPAEALRLGAKVWVVDPTDDTLQIRQVTVARRTAKVALITAGLNDGDQVVLTGIGGALSGMKLRVRRDKPPGQKKTKETRPQKGPSQRGGPQR